MTDDIPTPLTSSADARRWLSASNLVTKVAGPALLLTYALGFIVISLNEARFGISTFDVFRPKIISAGISFVVLTTLPAVTCLAALRKSGPSALEQWGVLSYAAFAGFILANIQLGLHLMVTDAQAYGGQWSIGNGALLIVGVLLLILLFTGMYRKVRRFAAALQILIPLALIGWQWWFAPEGPRALGLWWVIVTGVVGLIRIPNRLKPSWGDFATHDRTWLPLLLVAIVFYSQQVYGRLNRAYGGGAPMPVKIMLKSSLPRWQNVGTISVDLLDETPNGFYFLDGTDKQAVYVPRSEVQMMEFMKKQPAGGSKKE